MSIVAFWSVVYVARLLRGPARWYTVVDAGILMVLCLGTRWMVPADWLVAGHSWIMAFASFACVAYQCHTGLTLGLAATAGVIGSLVAGSYTAAPAGSPIDIVITTTWSVVGAVLSRSLWILVRRGGVLADRAMADAEQARTRQRVAQVVRADESELANALHDTAAATLLMVGVGRIPKDQQLLAAQAERDMAVLRTYGESLPDRSDLSSLLRAAANLIPIDVHFEGMGPLSLPAEVAGAIADAAGEALNNVVKHAMVDEVFVRVEGHEHEVLVVIVDRGAGFSVDRVPETRRGLRESIHGRMERIRGHAYVASKVGRGTSVRLEWTDA
ncbi:ATP-binding protein [Actinocrispum sp. NPDC049592]|uniref:sensor histidine kinase n=1 Tax=Actinocrispum sp. NPDC049592 TaxID=3154835 RepID=UPI003447C09E